MRRGDAWDIALPIQNHGWEHWSCPNALTQPML
jgi:hypothetical protein